MFDLFREILQTMRNNKLRTALTGISVAWGIFMLIILLGMSRGVYNSFNNSFRAQSANTLQMWGGNTTVPYHGYKEGRSIQLKYDDPDAVMSHDYPNVTDAEPVVYGETVTISTSRDYMSAYYEGVSPEFIKMQGYKIIAGRFINEADVIDSRKVVVMAERNVNQLFDSPEDAIGKYVNVGGLSFKVIGVYSSDWGQNVYVPYSTVKSLNGHKPTISSMHVKIDGLKTVEDGERLEARLREGLARKHEFSTEDESAIFIWNRFTNHLQMSNGLGILNMAVWVIGIFTMLSGIIGVSNIMFVSVKERTHEIGIRRAIGAKPRSILTQIILESVVITGLFGYIGVVCGIGVTELLNLIFSDSDFLKDPTVTVAIALQVTLVLIIAGSMAGLFPALKALKVKPVEALRTE